LKNKNVTTRYVAVFALAIVLIVLVVLAVNTFGLKSYYETRKVDSMEEAYGKIDAAIEDGDTKLLESILKEYSESENISIAVYDSYTSSAMFSSERDNEFLLQKLRDELFKEGDSTDEANEVIRETENYRITKSQTNISLFGYCHDNRMMVLMSIPVEGMRNAASQSTRFLLVVAAAALVIGFTAVIVLTTRLSRTYALEMENERLQHDLAEKERQNEIQREFIANVSHELKTPIALVQGYAEGLSEGMGEDKESRKYYSDVIVDEARKMNRIVQQLLMLSSIESGTSQLETSAFNFSEMIKGIAESIGILADQKQVTVVTDIPEGIYVLGDEFKLESVVTNYLSNAINHVNEGGTIKICLSNDETRARLSVFNTGSRIPEDQLEQIWEKFYKVDKAHTRSYGGSGIGLSIVRAVMDAHEMPYGVRNHENGVEFWLELEFRKI